MELLELAKEYPACDYCGIENPNGDRLCLCHSNALQDGRGASFKSHDLFGAMGCHACHDLVDGRNGTLNKHQKRAMHEAANKKMLRWLVPQIESITLKDGRKITL